MAMRRNSEIGNDENTQRLAGTKRLAKRREIEIGDEEITRYWQIL